MNDDRIGMFFESQGYAWVTRNVTHTMGMFSYDHIFVRGMGVWTKNPVCGVADARGRAITGRCGR